MNEKNTSRSGIRTANKLSGFCQNTDVRALCFLVIILSVSCCFMFRDYLFGNELMIFNDIGSDTWQQYIMNYTSIVNHLRDGSFSLWDFNNGLGINQFNFNLFDPFLMLLYLHQCDPDSQDHGGGICFLLVSLAVFIQCAVQDDHILCICAEWFSSGVGTALPVWNCCDLFSADASFLREVYSEEKG